jgi:hypothetical protein
MSPFLQRVLVSALIIFGIWIAAFFGLRTLYAYSEVRKHRPPPPPFKTEQPETDVALIQDWMTVPFIERMYQIHHGVLFQALNIPAESNRDKSLKQINEKYFPNQSGFVLKLVKTTVQANLPPPAPVSSAAANPTVAATPVAPP